MFGGNASEVAAGICAWALTGVLILHNFLFSSSPRLILPYLPFFLMLAPRALTNRAKRVVLPASALVLLGLWLLAWRPEVASWDWGLLESSGVTLEQRLPVGTLPRTAPATLHVRIAPLDVGTTDLILSLDGQVLFRGSAKSTGKRALLSIPLPSDITRENARAPVLLRLRSEGNDPHSYWVFPVVPAPWRDGARRMGDPALSPRTDVGSGSLDWWAHEGTDGAEATQRN